MCAPMLLVPIVNTAMHLCLLLKDSLTEIVALFTIKNKVSEKKNH